MSVRKLPRQRHLIPVPEAEWPASPPGHRRPVEVYCSRDFLVQVYHERGAYRLSVCSTRVGTDGRWLDGISWDVLQRLKREAGFGDHWAVEIYPADLDVVNVANMRHLWVLAEAPPYGWRRNR